MAPPLTQAAAAAPGPWQWMHPGAQSLCCHSACPPAASQPPSHQCLQGITCGETHSKNKYFSTTPYCATRQPRSLLKTRCPQGTNTVRTCSMANSSWRYACCALADGAGMRQWRRNAYESCLLHKALGWPHCCNAGSAAEVVCAEFVTLPQIPVVTNSRPATRSLQPTASSRTCTCQPNGHGCTIAHVRVEALRQQSHNLGALLRSLHQHKAQAQHSSTAHVIADIADSKVQQPLHSGVVGGAPAALSKTQHPVRPRA